MLSLALLLSILFGRWLFIFNLRRFHLEGLLQSEQDKARRLVANIIAISLAIISLELLKGILAAI